MSVATRRATFVGGFLGIVVAVLIISGALSSGTASADGATAAAIDCSQLQSKDDQYKCRINRCDSRGAASPFCKRLEQQLGGGREKTPAETCNGGRTGTVNGKSVCLKPGQKCKKKYKSDYAAAGFKCKAKKNKKTGKTTYKLKSTGG